MDLSLSQNFEDLLAIDKSRYFAQPRPIIVKYFINYTDINLCER